MRVRTERNGAVWTVILNRPEARNAVDPETAAALLSAFAAFDADEAASVAVFHGEGGAFCAGYDLKHAAGGADEIGGLSFGEAASNDARGPMGPTRMALSKPVIAAIAGPAVAGGMELALWCDMRVMEEDAYFGVYCRRWGVPLIDGGTVRLPRLVGMGRAMDLILTGRKVEAEESLRIGLCDRVVPKGAARSAAEVLAHEIARFPQACVRADRRSAYAQWDLAMRDALRQEFEGSVGVFEAEGLAGAGGFAGGQGRGGSPAGT
ncbi:crotonase/enoyl-CoA hydratase family protein [Microbaculum marinum]|uniref:Crotonase/enoyl-CoA hydratase family protein n=1 Tax=Microbaculum marinum TaxID=1764581 RepID=A0AAW9RZE9_9HYPH